MTKFALQIETDEPVMVLVMPLRKAAPRSVPPFRAAPQIVETTGEAVAEPANVVPFARTLRKVG